MTTTDLADGSPYNRDQLLATCFHEEQGFKDPSKAYVTVWTDRSRESVQLGQWQVRAMWCVERAPGRWEAAVECLDIRLALGLKRRVF